jgi:hypothetical protein
MVELVTFKCEVSTAQFICVKPEPRKQVARKEEKNLWRGASYTYLYILASGAECGLPDSEKLGWLRLVLGLVGKYIHVHSFAKEVRRTRSVSCVTL